MDINLSQQILAEKRKKTLNKPFRTPSGPKKFSVYVKNEKGNVVKVNFGDPNMEIKRDDPNRRKNFRARHNCDNPGPKTKARYWSCRQWRGGKKVEASIQSLADNEYEWDGETLFDHDQLIEDNPELAYIEEEITEASEGDCCGGNCDCDCNNCEKESCSCNCHDSIADLLDSGNEVDDHEISMAITQLTKVAMQSAALVRYMRSARDGANLMAWTQDKVSKAEHMIEAVYDYYMYNQSNAALTDKQKKLPPALREAIMKKKGKKTESKNGDKEESKDKSDNKKSSKPDFMDVDKDGDKKEPMKKALKDKESKGTEEEMEEKYASLWKNIHNKRERIKKGSGEKMRKKGEKGAPTPEQLKKAKKKTVKAEEEEPQKAKAEYEMSQDEFNEVITVNDIILENLEAAKRSGRKSAAQTPAKPSERKKGSSKNKKGSAGKGGSSITFSAKVTESLKNKVKEHNAKSKRKVTLSQLKKVYRRGAGAFSSSHRPGQSRGSWAMARVNMFLKMKRGGKVKDSYRAADGDI